jgi:fatty acid desaturase
MGLPRQVNANVAKYPYRALIRPDERARLSTPQPRRVARDIALLWLQIFAVWALAAWIATPLAVLVAAAIVGNRYYSLFIIGHDGLHRRLHPDVSRNDLINDVCILGAICAITRVNRINHMQHHQTLGMPSDPDRFKYESRVDLSTTRLLFSFTGVPLVLQAAANVFVRRPTTSTVEKPKYIARDAAIIALWQLCLLAWLTFLFGWWGYFAMWVLPIAVFAVAFDLVRVFCEHSVESDSPAIGTTERLIMIDSSPLERALFAPMNMNHHVAHHVWPSIPYFNLPQATALIAARGADDGQPLIRRSGYCSYLARYVARSLRDGRQTGHV